MLPWVKLDDGFAEHPKIIDLSDRALRLHVAALCYSARNLTDGVLVVRSIETCCALTRATRRHTTELTDAGLWTAHADGFLIRDFLDYNPSSAKVKSDRSAARERMKLVRDPDLRESIRARDGDNCRYCGTAVKWRDRRGTAGGTYDHVDPNGGSHISNLVVACRGCNSRKGPRTPEQAGLTLIDLDPYLDTNLDQNLGSATRSSANGRSGTPSRPLKKSTSAFIAEAIDQSLKAS